MVYIVIKQKKSIYRTHAIYYILYTIHLAGLQQRMQELMAAQAEQAGAAE